MKSLLTNITLWSLTIGHFCIDLFSGALPIVMVFVAQSVGLSLAEIGLVLGLYSLTSSVTQPVFGLLSDRHGGRWFSVGGLLWMAGLYALIGWMTTFEGVLLVTALAGLGSAAFHPQGASGANIAAGDRKTAGVAIFMLGGNGGYALGPIVAAALLGAFGSRGTAAMSVVGLALSVLLVRVSARAAVPARKPSPGGKLVALNPAYGAIAIAALMAVMSLRAAAQASLTAYVPQYFIKVAGFDVSLASSLTSLLLLMLAVGALVGGFAADRVGPWRVMIGSLLASTPLMLLMLLLKDGRAFLVAPLIGFAAGTAWPPMLVMAQDLFPKNHGVGSGIALGFVFAIGGIGTTLTGALAEQIGLETTMLIVCALPVAAALCAFALPNRRRAVAASASAARVTPAKST